ncbi:protein Skeletor, isoforms B/C-like [Haemaphysalis longicornis]
MILTHLPGIFGAAYYGKLIGKINTHAHSFTGNVYAVSEKQVYITDFNYDGTGPKAYFWVGSGSQGPDLASGNRTVDEDGSSNILMGYKNSRVLLTLPNKITAYGYIGIFCVEFKHNFGEVFVPASFGLPEEVKMGSLAGMLSGVKADEVTLKDSANIELKNFNYDGTGKEVHFAVGSDKNAKKGTLVKLLDENGKSSKLEKYSDKTVTLKLPEGHHWIEFKWFTVYSFETDASLGELEIPNDISGKLPVHNPSSEVHKFAVGHAPLKKNNHHQQQQQKQQHH